MSFQRRILHHGPSPAAIPQVLSLSAMKSCWFELHRQGGCGAGELVLSDDFEARHDLSPGDWISFDYSTGNRWYLGRIEERSAELPARIRYRLAGMGIELNQIFPGGFGMGADGPKPHRYAATDLFQEDPDYAIETVDSVSAADEVVRSLIQNYVSPSTHIQYVPSLVESPLLTSPLQSLKLRGEESVRSLLKELATRAQSASWGVDAEGRFFFLRPRTTLLHTFQEQQDLTKLAETRDLEFLFNRLLLTGDYVYNPPQHSGDVARRVYRWRGNYYEPTSQAQFGNRRLKIWLPWIRTQSDSVAFAKEFFRTYSQPHSRYFIETQVQSELPVPWLGEVRVLDRAGTELVRSRIETIRVLFDHAPRFRMELGPEDPRSLWPEPPQDERWELPHRPVSAGGVVSMPPPLPTGEGGGGNGGDGTSHNDSEGESLWSEWGTSWGSLDDSSLNSHDSDSAQDQSVSDIASDDRTSMDSTEAPPDSSTDESSNSLIDDFDDSDGLSFTSDFDPFSSDVPESSVNGPGSSSETSIGSEDSSASSEAIEEFTYDFD
ncbi:hypothetical protein SH668x_000317 [Planctomicrobium sp. SH668]|uniref:hypothetical protein n=1 Tax=Planctomicrobium sp. SH668 TaxID=3448126 RepID=UPI003F5B00D4